MKTVDWDLDRYCYHTYCKITVDHGIVVALAVALAVVDNLCYFL